MLQNVRSFADAELDLVRAICLARLKAVQASAIALVAAALLCLSALTAPLVGLVIALGPIIGPFVATFAVSLGVLAVGRSEEHTYELQSLIRLPYVVLRLIKNNT